MPQKIPFFQLFPDLTPPPALKAALLGTLIRSAVIHQKDYSMEMTLETRSPLAPEELRALEEMILRDYAFTKVTLQADCVAPPPPPPAERVGEGKPSGGGAGKNGDLLYGREIKGKPVPIRGLNLKMGPAVITGRVFSADCHETRKPGLWRLAFEMTDEDYSVLVQKNLTTKEAQSIGSKIQPGMYLTVQGRMEPTWDGKDIQMMPMSIMMASHPQRQDTAPEKRVELHLHTKMSNMDALTDTGDAVKTAIRWGHPAIAITDHGVAQSFPDATKAAKGKIKILYGMEGYFINNLDDRIAVHGRGDAPLEEDIVCFDIETTGLNVTREEITEIGAVVLRNGEVRERFQTFVDPGRKLPQEIIGLTGITDEMLKGAPKPAEALRAFLDFVDGRTLAAHNAEFDIGFIREGCR
ncbi:MAG: exonuclease domain-containing protein, partial [Dysosmobacter sp.]|nr:exonuclease domain-containing protein [Dysosmobacter sp.]